VIADVAIRRRRNALRAWARVTRKDRRSRASEDEIDRIAADPLRPLAHRGAAPVLRPTVPTNGYIVDHDSGRVNAQQRSDSAWNKPASEADDHTSSLPHCATSAWR
jgi:hypothetical protein